MRDRSNTHPWRGVRSKPMIKETSPPFRHGLLLLALLPPLPPPSHHWPLAL